MSRAKRKCTTTEFDKYLPSSDDDSDSGARLQPKAPIYGSLKQHYERHQRRVKFFADKAVFSRPYAMGPPIFSEASEDSFIYARMSEKMTEVQKTWAKNFLVSAWNDPAIRCGNRLKISDDLILALSWFTGVDVFKWRCSNLAQLFFHICYFGGLKAECKTASNPRTSQKLIYLSNFLKI
jgi:hypothetical protein